MVIIDKSVEDFVENNEDMRLVEGYASVQIKDQQGDIVPIKSMENAMFDYMDRGGLIMYGHTSKPVGKVLHWVVEKDKAFKVPSVKIVAKLNVGYKIDDQAWSEIKSGNLKGFSIGGQAIETSETKGDDGVSARVLDKIELSEISLVEMPANQGAVLVATSIAKGVNKKGTVDEHENVVDEHGNSIRQNSATEKPVKENPIAEDDDNDENKTRKGNIRYESCVAELEGEYGTLRAADICDKLYPSFKAKGLKEEPQLFIILDEPTKEYLDFMNEALSKEFPVVKGESALDFAKFLFYSVFNKDAVICKKVIEKKYKIGIDNFIDWVLDNETMKSDYYEALADVAYDFILKNGGEKYLLLKIEKLDDGKEEKPALEAPETVPSLEQNREKYPEPKRPEYYFWNYCTKQAMQVYPTERLARGLCGYLFYHKFKGDHGSANKWAYYRERIDVDDLKAYNKFHAQKVLSYFFDETGENEKKGLLINPKTRKLILKIKNSVVDIQKPFAGFKDFADCVNQNKKKYGKDGANRVCGSLKHKYEKALKDAFDKANYPWEQCIKDNESKYGKEGAKRICGSIRSKYDKSIGTAILKMDDVYAVFANYIFSKAKNSVAVCPLDKKRMYSKNEILLKAAIVSHLHEVEHNEKSIRNVVDYFLDKTAIEALKRYYPDKSVMAALISDYDVNEEVYGQMPQPIKNEIEYGEDGQARNTVMFYCPIHSKYDVKADTISSLKDAVQDHYYKYMSTGEMKEIIEDYGIETAPDEDYQYEAERDESDIDE